MDLCVRSGLRWCVPVLAMRTGVECSTGAIATSGVATPDRTAAVPTPSSRRGQPLLAALVAAYPDLALKSDNWVPACAGMTSGGNYCVAWLACAGMTSGGNSCVARLACTGMTGNIHRERNHRCQREHRRRGDPPLPAGSCRRRCRQPREHRRQRIGRRRFRRQCGEGRGPVLRRHLVVGVRLTHAAPPLRARIAVPARRAGGVRRARSATEKLGVRCISAAISSWVWPSAWYSHSTARVAASSAASARHNAAASGGGRRRRCVHGFEAVVVEAVLQPPAPAQRISASFTAILRIQPQNGASPRNSPSLPIAFNIVSCSTSWASSRSPVRQRGEHRPFEPAAQLFQRHPFAGARAAQQAVGDVDGETSPRWNGRRSPAGSKGWRRRAFLTVDAGRGRKRRSGLQYRPPGAPPILPAITQVRGVSWG